MAKNKRNLEGKASLKKLLMADPDKVPAIKILASSANRRMVQAVVDAITSRYGNERITYVPKIDQNEYELAYTDGRNVVNNLNNVFINAERTLEAKRLMELAMVSHECGHILFTDMANYQEYLKAWKSTGKIDFPVCDYPYYDKGVFDEINNYFKDYPDIVLQFVHTVNNVMEDPYVEWGVKQLYSGSPRKAIKYWETKLKANKNAEPDEEGEWFNNTLKAARCFLPSDAPEVFFKINRLSRANMAGFCTFDERLGRALAAVQLLWTEYLKPQVDEAIMQQKLQELLQQLIEQAGSDAKDVQNQKQNNGMASQQVAGSSGSGSSSNSSSGRSQKRNGSMNKKGSNNSGNSGQSEQENGSEQQSGDSGNGSENGEKDSSSASSNSNGGDTENGQKDGSEGQSSSSSASNDANTGNSGDSKSMSGGMSDNFQPTELGYGSGEGGQRSLFDSGYLDSVNQETENAKNKQNSQNSETGNNSAQNNSGSEIGNSEFGEGVEEHVDEDEYFSEIEKRGSENQQSAVEIGDMGDETELRSRAINELMTNDEDFTQKLADECEISEINASDCHRGVNCKVYHIKTGDAARYQEVAERENISKLSKNLQRKIKKDVFERQRGVVKHNLYSGKNLDLKAVACGSDKVFKQNKLPNKRPVLSTGILIDCSGSMSGNKIYKATVASMLLEDFCRNLNIPFTVVGHSTCGSIVEMYNYIEFGERNTSARTRLAEITSNSCNRDGFAIRYVAEKMRKRQEMTKLLFVISDGLPNHNGYGTSEMIADLKDMKKKYKKDGILIVPLCIEEGCFESLKRIYGASLVDATDLNKLPIQLNTILLKELKKKFE